MFIGLALNIVKKATEFVTGGGGSPSTSQLLIEGGTDALLIEGGTDALLLQA